MHLISPYVHSILCLLFFFFNDTATTEIYTLSLHDALPTSRCSSSCAGRWSLPACATRASTSATWRCSAPSRTRDRKSTRLNSSHSQISYAVFCLKKKKKKKKHTYICNHIESHLSTLTSIHS